MGGSTRREDGAGDGVDRLNDLLDAPFDEGGESAGGRHRGRVPLLSVPASLRSVDLGVGMHAVRGAVVLTVVVLLVLGGRWVWTALAAAPGPADTITTSSGGRASQTVTPTSPQTVAPGPEPPDGAQEDAPAPTPETLLVHVTGEVVEPGVVAVPAGARVVDAIEEAGGLTRSADGSTINLARAVVDGEQLWVGRPGEQPPDHVGPPPAAGGIGAAGQTSGSTGSAGGVTPAVVDLNAATEADLDNLPGIGPVTAGKILAWREEHGRFTSVQELLEVSGIGERTLAELEPHVTVGP